MAVFAGGFVVLLIVFQRESFAGAVPAKASVAALAVIALPVFPKVTPAYREVLETRSYFFLTNWAWYEWLGLLGPFAVLAWDVVVGKTEGIGCYAFDLQGADRFRSYLFRDSAGDLHAGAL